MSKLETTVAIGGIGAIGMEVARRLDKGIRGLSLAAVSAANHKSACERLNTFCNPPPIIPVEALADVAEIVVECLPSTLFEQIAEPTVRAGGILVTLSCGSLLANSNLVKLARKTGSRIIVPTGALVGLDAVRAAAQGKIYSVSMSTQKSPKSLMGAPYLEDHNINIDKLKAPLKVFSGSAREGAMGFPANVNVAAALSLAGIGADRTMLEIWAVPGLTRNVHIIEVDSDSAKFSLAIENIPSDTNPRTGKITALSVIACLNDLSSTLKIGT